jgi:hypothetical protein
MAVVLAFRIAIVLGPASVRVLKWAEGPGVAQIPKALESRLRDPSESDADLTLAVADATGRLASVATYTGSFETRKVQMSFSFAGGSNGGEDKRVCTFHLLKLAGGSPSDAWAAADFEAAETALDAFWTSIKQRQNGSLRLSQFRWYKAGPSIVPPTEAVRVVERDVPGTSGNTLGLPPQIACAITEKTSSRSAWGRVYIPMSGSQYAGLAQMTADGRFNTDLLTDFANAADTLYEACKAAGIPVVVYSAAKPIRPKKPSGTLPATVARALTVDDIQVDDIPDVIRSRRHGSALLKVQRAIT